MLQISKKKRTLFKRPAQKIIVLTLLSAVLIGSAVAFFLKLLDLATAIRIRHAWLVFLLPFAGLLIHGIYRKYGADAEGGNNLILEEIQKPQKGVPVKMAPLILFSTVITHLFGGSAGREGTAVQMGGSLARWVGSYFRIPIRMQRQLLYAGIAAGFGAVFGTPFAGAIFAVEVVAIGAIQYRSLLLCLVAAWIGHVVCLLWGIEHTTYRIQSGIPLSGKTVLLAILSGLAFGLCSAAFTKATRLLKSFWNYLLQHNKYAIPLIAGSIIAAISVIPSMSDYLGLGVYPSRAGGASIVSAFQEGGVDWLSWLWKAALTVLTIGSGFKGGEVTPLFFIGAALGNTISILSGTPADLFAGLGFIAVFAGASNTPLACIIMGIELFGPEYTALFGLSCYTAYLCSDHQGIYAAQAIHRRKWSANTHKKD